MIVGFQDAREEVLDVTINNKSLDHAHLNGKMHSTLKKSKSYIAYINITISYHSIQNAPRPKLAKKNPFTKERANMPNNLIAANIPKNVPDQHILNRKNSDFYIPKG